MSDTTELAVIGAGPGGYTAAFQAADRGLSVTLIDDAPRPGGVCLHRGCMPSKALLHAAKVVTDARASTRWGIDFGTPSIDPVKLRVWKDEVVAKLTGGLGQLSTQRKVRYLQGRAAFADAHRLTVAPPDGAGAKTDIVFEHAILATGSRPARPAALALDDPRVLDSTGALDVEQVPSTLLVIGGGYIGLELGTVYAALGSAVTVVEMTSSLPPRGGRRPRPRACATDRSDRRGCPPRYERDPPGPGRGRDRRVARGAGDHRAGAALRVGAGGRGARPQLGRRRTRSDRCRARRPRVRQRGWPAAHGRADDLRHRRRGGRADAGAQSVPRGSRGGRGDHRRRVRFRAARDSGRGVHRPGSGVVRTHRGGGVGDREGRSRWRGSHGVPPAAHSRSTGRTA